MTDDLGAHDVEELRALMRKHHLLPDVPVVLTTAPSLAAGPSATREQGSDASEAMLAGILATSRPASAATGTAGPRATGPVAPAGETSRRRRGRRRPAVLAVAAATAVVAVVGSQMGSAPTAVAGGAPPLSYALGTPDAAWDDSLPSAHDTLVELAAVAEDSPDLPRTGDVQFVSLYSWLSELDTDTLTTTVYPTADEWWTAPDGSGQLVQRRAQAVLYDGQVDTTAGESGAGTLSSDDHPPGTRDPSAAAGLPTDPAGMEAALLALAPQAYAEVPEYRDIVLVQSALEQYQASIVPQDVASAMWTVLSDAPTVRLLGDTTDRLGRPGVGVAVADPLGEPAGVEAVTVLIISPTDGQLLGTETVTLTDPVIDVDEPTVTGFTTVTDRRWVAAVGD